MKQIVIISGKGGTGKTVITGSFAALAQNKVMADCDVDAADLHLLMAPEIKARHVFRSGVTAVIDPEKCTGCGKCNSLCRFDAIQTCAEDARTCYEVDPVSCEGCGFCSHVCPAGAISLEENESGEWFLSDTRFGPMVHARLGIAEENSGKLVALVRTKAKELCQEQRRHWVIVDGAPGIGCPVIASLSGVDCAVVVTEPTLSGLHDAERVIGVAAHFNVLTKVIVNKYNLNTDMTARIEQFCNDRMIDVVGKIPFDENVVRAMVENKTIIEYGKGDAAKAVSAAWNALEDSLQARA